jgi:hypothetical protein
VQFFRGLSFFLIIISVVNGVAYENCWADKYMISSGYLLSRNQISILEKNRPLNRNVKKLKADKLNAVEKSILATWSKNKSSGISAADLAQLIVEVSESVGVDYQILAAIIKKESNYCLFRLNKTGGDSGCMQFTSPALTEMKHQMGYAGSNKHSAGVPEALDFLARRHFSLNDPNRIDVYSKWLKSSINTIKTSLRKQANYDFDILTGALFLKFSLANANGNYGLAVRNYNGSSKKLAYQQSVIASASKVYLDADDYNVQSCQDALMYEKEIQRQACELTEEPQDCFEQFLQTLPNYT